ncbi:LppX_LprAFG lipoprotein [Tsukamurella soli]
MTGRTVRYGEASAASAPARIAARTPVRVAVVALAGMLVLLAGCSSGGSGGSGASAAPKGPLPSAATLQAEATAATKNLHDVDVDLEVDGTVPNLPVKSITGYITNQPVVAAQGNADVTVFGSEVQARFVVQDGILWARMSGDKYSDMGKAADTYDPSIILDPDRGLGNIVAKIRDAKVEGRENIDGIDTVRMSGIVPGPVIGVLAPKSHLGDLPTTFWVQEAAPHNLVSAHVAVGTATISIDLSQWGVKQTITKPGS